ncbi:MAG: 1-phosphofructokinase family hexose kinase [Eubacteriales bacterium]
MKRQRDIKIKDFTDIPELPDECFDKEMPKDLKFAVLSLNPGIDRALYLPAPLCEGGLNRAARSVTTQGSKGANVAIMLHRLGCKVEYYTFSGGEFGELANSFLTREGIRVISANSLCGVRLNTKVIDSNCTCTELNERGGVFRPSEIAELTDMFMSTDADVICLCGSIPQGVEKDVYKFFCEFGKVTGKRVVLDCDGEALKIALEARPDLIKPNEYELEKLGLSTSLFGKFSQDRDTRDEEITAACVKVAKTYGTTVICTRGADGSVLATPEGKVITRESMKVRMIGFSGAGDTFLAGYIAARYSKGFTEEYSLIAATAAGAMKVVLEGSELPEASDIDEAIDDIIRPKDKTPKNIPIEHTLVEGIEPWNKNMICHSNTKK